MTKYIDLQEFLNQYKGNIWTAKIDYAQGIRDVVDDLKKFPSADVAPVIHAHWTRYPSAYECSSCGYLSQNKHKFCPLCGARMDEEVKK